MITGSRLAWVTGEIAIRSRYICPGYWRQSDLTRDKFRTDGGEERTFLSGDLGFMLPDGLLYHAGRKDFQVKIRGNRLEIGEVETALRAVDGIREVAVVKQSQGIDIRLIAYIVTGGKPAPSVSALRRALAEKLPEHMIPSAFVMLAAMPLTSNGKVDRRALPEPEQRRSELGVDYVAPCTPVEETLARIWADAIGLAHVGIHDNFFELGTFSPGHSNCLSDHQGIRVRDVCPIFISISNSCSNGGGDHRLLGTNFRWDKDDRNLD
jgi:hypothetical protein